MPATMLTSNVALKEWSIVVEALAEGKQLILVRKGGIRDPKGAFQLEHREFLLYPTLEHQGEKGEAVIRPEFRQQYRGFLTPSQRPCAVGLKVYAGVSYCGQVQDPARLLGLEKYHIWMPEFFEERMRYRPLRPTLVVVLRAYLLPEPLQLPVKPEYTGCKSWVPLDENIPIEGAQPVIDNQRFRRALEEISSRLEGR